MTEHKTWLDNEYSLWVKALQESTVHTFKEHPMVKRMLGDIDDIAFADVFDVLNGDEVKLIAAIDSIGKQDDVPISGVCLRMIYYALAVLDKNPTSIVEIGGGVGQFYAILLALGYKGWYYIYDLPEVQQFQYKYFKEIEKQTGLNFPLGYVSDDFDFCVSFYALGEFDDELKRGYLYMVVNDCPHGYIAWNPHSGATDDLTLFTHDIKVTPGREPNIKIIEW